MSDQGRPSENMTSNYDPNEAAVWIPGEKCSRQSEQPVQRLKPEARLAREEATVARGASTE